MIGAVYAGHPELSRANWIEINLDGIQHNLNVLKSYCAPGTKFLFPVKADAYGHGSLACSFAARQAGVDYLGVAHVPEAVMLRQYGMDLPILVLGPILEPDFIFLEKFNLTGTLVDMKSAIALNQWAQGRNKPKVHLKVDTGMGRYGFSLDQIDELIQVLQMKNILVEGVFSHMPVSDTPNHPLTQQQIIVFKQLQQQLQAQTTSPLIFHLSNSAGVFNFCDASFDMVRPGLSLYGYNYDGSGLPHPDLIPLMKMKATVRQITEFPAGYGISYGQTWIAPKPTRVAAVAIGYGDGFSRGHHMPGFLWIQNRPCPILGRICMDTTMVDISDLDVHLGDRVDVVDHEISPDICFESMAVQHETIPYEMTCRVARRLYRHYIYQGQALRWDNLRHVLGVQDFNANLNT
jgi:alanine racemase